MASVLANHALPPSESFDGEKGARPVSGGGPEPVLTKRSATRRLLAPRRRQMGKGSGLVDQNHIELGIAGFVVEAPEALFFFLLRP